MPAGTHDTEHQPQQHVHRPDRDGEQQKRDQRLFAIEEQRPQAEPAEPEIPEQLAEEEAYTVFCIDSPLVSEEGPAVGAETWWRANRRAVASLLTQEPDIDYLSKQEADESTDRYLSYYERDLVVVDWDAALIVGFNPKIKFTRTQTIMSGAPYCDFRYELMG